MYLSGKKRVQKNKLQIYREKKKRKGKSTGLFLEVSRMNLSTSSKRHIADIQYKDLGMSID